MKTLIREKRKLVFEKKIISPNVIRDFAGIIDNEIKASSKKDTEMFAVFSIEANDDSSYESQSVEIFREGDLLDKKSAVKVGMRFNTRDYSKNIELQLVHISDIDEATGSENFILVSGDDPTWVNGILARYNEIISLTENQADYKKFVKGTVFVVTLIINIIYFRLFFEKIDKIEPEWIGGLLTIGFPILTFGLSENLTNYISSLWPDMEFQTGPDYLQKPSLKRRKLIWIVVTLLIPIIIGLIYDVVKSSL